MLMTNQRKKNRVFHGNMLWKWNVPAEVSHANLCAEELRESEDEDSDIPTWMEAKIWLVTDHRAYGMAEEVVGRV